MRTAFDGSVIIAALQEWHPDNDRAAAAVGRALKEDKKPLLPVPALIQAFSVLTRMPRGTRMSPHDALARLRDNFATRTTLVPQDEASTWKFLDLSVAKGVEGGAIYDADILACAERGGATRLLTLNPEDFERLGPTDVEIVVP
jgi:predicted nucleic acid-binding protein